MSDFTDLVAAELQAALPPVFAGKSFDELTGNAIHWPSIQNARSRGEIPDECFAYSGRKVLVRRDLFFNWWRGTLRASDGRKTGGRGDA